MLKVKQGFSWEWKKRSPSGNLPLKLTTLHYITDGRGKTTGPAQQTVCRKSIRSNSTAMRSNSTALRTKVYKRELLSKQEGNLRGERASAKHQVPGTPGGQQSHSHWSQNKASAATTQTSHSGPKQGQVQRLERKRLICTLVLYLEHMTHKWQAGDITNI